MKTTTQFATAIAILAGGMMFSGSANATNVIVNGTLPNPPPRPSSAP
jgi:hypothetical protein